MEAGVKKGRTILIFLLTAAVYAAAELGLTALIYGAVFSRYEAVEPPESSMPYTEVAFDCRGDALFGRLYECGSGLLVIMIPGIHAESAELAPAAEAICGMGYSVLIFDPAGTGKSGGDARGFYRIVYDTDACIRFAEENGLFGAERAVLLGHSRGGYAACIEAAEHDCVCAAAALSAPDTPLEATLAGSQAALGTVGRANAAALFTVQSMLFSPQETLASASDALARCKKPALILQGENDSVVPCESFSVYSKREKLSDSARAVLLPCAHGDILLNDGEANEEAMKLIEEFLHGVQVTAGRSG